MALSLTAEQKEILKIFKIEEQYIVPPYQRPYSWDIEHCSQFYTDIFNSFKDNQDYFIGNIIISQGENNKDYFEVVDGQQRLITILLLLKVLSLYQTEMKILRQLIEKEDWLGQNLIPRIRSDVFETNDGEELNKILSYDTSMIKSRLLKVQGGNGQIIQNKCSSKFEQNLFYFYLLIEHFISNHDDLTSFTTFLLKRVYLLPIQLSGASQDEANEKALIIFETINNRGLNLEDADIFKAKLYNNAKSIKEETLFIDSWSDFKSACYNLNSSIDDIFRYYSHIIRGKNGITSGEISLREFFINNPLSPILTKGYKDVIDDLFQIISILEFLREIEYKGVEATKWYQIILAYTNQYPKYAIVNYLYCNGINYEYDFISFLKTIIRYIYYQGSTSSIKFEIYQIIKQTSLKLSYASYIKEDINESFLNSSGRLKKGFALIAFYQENSKPLVSYNIDKIFTLKDKPFLDKDWDDVDFTTIIDSLANILIIDLPKKNFSFDKKIKYYNQSSLSIIVNIFNKGYISYNDFLNRENKLKNDLMKFFKTL